jgi:heme-degrading monooxygenase HmoA
LLGNPPERKGLGGVTCFSYPSGCVKCGFSDVRTGLRWVAPCPKVERVVARWKDRRATQREEACRVREGEYLRGPPELMDEGLRQAKEVVLHGAKQIDGFKGMIALGDRRSGKTLGITFWESEEAMRASEEAADRMREKSAERW